MRHSLATLLLCLFASQAIAAEHCVSSVYWLGDGSSGTKTASGERMNDNTLTAAHKSIKLGTYVKVTNRNNGKSVVVRINDRGPFVAGRCVDLTKAAARAISVNGLAPVSVEVVSPASLRAKSQ